MNLFEGKYSIVPAPEWAEPSTEEEIIQKFTPSEKGKQILDSGKQICFEFKEVLNTSNSKNEDYVFRSWIVNSSEVLQGAAIMDFVLRENEYIKMHRVFVCRNGKIIDKIQDINVRLFDNEQSSSYGTIDNQKKINCIVLDLRLGDIFVQEYTQETIFSEKNFLDKKFFRFFFRSPSSNWFYGYHLFKLINNRQEGITTKKSYFRDEINSRIPDELNSVKPGEHYIHEFVDHKSLDQDDVYPPFVEIVSDSSWEEISTYTTGYYQDLFQITQKECQDLLFPFIELDNNPELLDSNLQTVIEFVQNQIVYLFDAEVMHGYIPENTQKTIQVKSGDCKAKSLLLMHLLKGLGIESDLILVNYDYDYHLAHYLPSPFIFNHMILKIRYKGEEYFVDSTL